jgi:hypothetical protein
MENPSRDASKTTSVFLEHIAYIRKIRSRLDDFDMLVMNFPCWGS